MRRGIEVMRKLITILILGCLIGLTACSVQPNPTKPLEEFMTAFQAGASASDDLTEYFSAEGKFALKLDAFDAGSDNEELVKTMDIIIRDIDYEIIEKKIEKDTAIITMKITSHDIAGAYRQWIDGIMTRAMEWINSGKTQEELLATELELLNEALISTAKDKVDTVDVYMVLVDKVWQITDSEENLPFLDVLTGGFLSMVEDFEDPITEIE